MGQQEIVQPQQFKTMLLIPMVMVSQMLLITVRIQLIRINPMLIAMALAMSAMLVKRYRALVVLIIPIVNVLRAVIQLRNLEAV